LATGERRLVSVTLASRDPSAFYRSLDEHPSTDLIIVDFDETLWLRNSTEEFLHSVRPRFLAAIVLQLLSALKPWRLFQRGTPNHYRDWIRVLAVQLVAPWSLWLWRRKAAELGPRHVNLPLLDAVRRNPAETMVVSFGFREIVQPLLAAIDPRLPLLRSCSFQSGASLRKEGKALALQRHIGTDRCRQALVITDSEADRDLLHASDKAFLIRWPDSRYEQAGFKPLMPLIYLERVKRANENYLRNVVVGHDLPVLFLAYVWVSSQPLLASVALLLYVLSFFAAYETGYHENDRLGLVLEDKPRVSKNFHSLGHNFSPTFAWSVAILLAGAASLLAVRSPSWISGVLGSTPTSFFAVWGAFLLFLLVVRLLFRWQNVIEPRGRIIPMFGLQVGRLLGFAIIFPTTVVGALSCVALGVSRWVPYAVYRFGGQRSEVPRNLICLLLLTLFAGAVAIGGNPEAFLNWQSALIFAYVGARAAKELVKFAPRLLPLRSGAIR
jgi:phosphoserine phosphatase